jgi:HicB family
MAHAARRAEEPKPSYSGRLLLRMPPELHAEVARHAERERQSLNQFITGAVSEAVGWNGGVKRAESRSRLTSPRALTAALVVNLVVLALAGAAAIALLVLVWRGSV